MWEKWCEQIFSHCMLSFAVRRIARGRFLKQMQTQERRTLMPLLFSDGGLSPVLLWRRSKGSGVLSICFSCCQGVCTQQAACHTGRKLPRCPPRTPCIFFHSLPRSNHSPPIVECYLSHDYTWDPLASVPFLSSDQLLTPALYPLSFVLCPRINCELPGEQKRNWGSCGKKKKKKIDQGPGKLQKKTEDVSKCFLCNNFYPSHTFLLKATLLGTQKWVFLFGNNSRRASEATVKLLQSRCFFLSPINLTPTPPLSSFMLALAHQF